MNIVCCLFVFLFGRSKKILQGMRNAACLRVHVRFRMRKMSKERLVSAYLPLAEQMAFSMTRLLTLEGR
jgi:hypothetical protein